MKKNLVNEMLTLIAECHPSVKASNQYKDIKRILVKDNTSITHTEKLVVKENLRTLCSACGLSYERMIMRLYK